MWPLITRLSIQSNVNGSCKLNAPSFPVLFSNFDSLQQYKEMEDKVKAQLATFDGELKGTYYPLLGMDKATQQKLIDDHFLFKEGDRFLQAANACRYWPVGRGIFHNDKKTFLMWVNEEG